VGKYSPDHYRIFNTGDNLDVATAIVTSLYVDIKNPFQSSPNGAYFWCAQVIEARFSVVAVSVASHGALTFFTLASFAGVTSARYLLFCANIP